MQATLSGLLSGRGWSYHLVAHGWFQVFGLVGLFTQGLTLAMLPAVLQAPLWAPRLAWLALALQVGGLTLRVAPGGLGAPIWLAGWCLFLLVLRRQATADGPRTNRYLRNCCGAALLWLGLAGGLTGVPRTLALELAMWGFGVQMVAGWGLRLHPAILGLSRPSRTTLASSSEPGRPSRATLASSSGLSRPSRATLASASEPGRPSRATPASSSEPGRPSRATLPGAFALGNLGLALYGWGEFYDAPPLGRLGMGLLSLGVALFLGALRPWERPRRVGGAPTWLRSGIRLSYLWLGLALVVWNLSLWTAPGFAMVSLRRHLVGTGFLLTMMTAMGYKLVPNLEGRVLANPRSPGWGLGLLTLGNFLRYLGLLSGRPWLGLGGGCCILLSLLQFAYALARCVVPSPPTPSGPTTSELRPNLTQ